MEVAPCVQEASSQAASLLARLNLQREQAQFCDCVVRQRQNPSQLYPAHRCVLAASSPVWGSILSCTGALVELQAPCLSDSVLALILDYIYTGALPYTRSQQQYYNLLTAARYLQMDKLQEALRAWPQTEVNVADNINASSGAENQPYKDINNTYSKPVNTFSKYLPLSHIVNSLERKDHQYSANVDTRDEAQMRSASVDFRIKDVEINTCRCSSKNGANYCSRKDASTLSNVSTCCGMPESSVNTGNCRQVTHLTPQDLIQNICCTAEVHGVSGVDKEVQKDQFHSGGTVKPETLQKSIEEELVRTVDNRRSLDLLCTDEVQEEETSRAEKMQRLCLTLKSKAEEKQTNRKEEDKTQIHHSSILRLSTSHLKDNVSPSQCSSSSSSSSPHSCCGAVPVIRHSSRAAMLQLAEVSTMPPYNPVSQASVSSSRAPDSRSGSTDNDSIVEGITTKHKNHYGAQNQDYRNNKGHIGTQSWDYKDSSDQCAIQDLLTDILKQDHNSSNTDHDEHMGNGLFHITGPNDHYAHCDSFQNKNHTKHLRDDSVPLNEDCSSSTRRLKHKIDLSYDDFPSKHQRLDCSDCHNVSMATAAKEQSIHSQDLRAVVPLPVQDSDTGSDFYCEDLCPEGEAKEEHSYSSRCPAEMDRQDSHCNLHGPKTDWFPNLHRSKTSTKDVASSQHEHDSDIKDTSMTDKRHSVDVCLSVSSTPESCLDDVTCRLSAFNRRTHLELEKISGTETTEPHLTFTMPVDNVSDPTYSVVGPSYRGHLHYHCLPQENTHLLHGDSDHKHSHPSHPDHSDQSSDEDAVGTFASPLRQHFAAGTADQVLLLDISTKPAELLMSYKHRSTKREKGVAFCHKDTFGRGFVDNDREQWNEAISVAGVDKIKIRAGTKFGAESFNEAESKSWVEERNVEERKSVGKEQSRPEAEVIHKAGVVEGENQTTTLTVCSPPSVPDSVQASVSSTFSVCIPSTLSASMPTNISAHLSTPVHYPFQCSLCDRSFSQRGSLNRHVRSHLGVRPFPCPRCPMTFSRQYRVTEHMRVHQRSALGNDFQKPPASSI